MRKLFSFTLVVAVALSLGATAFAAAGDIAPAAFSDIAGHDAEEALTVLAALGVYSGEQGLGGPVQPDDPITRAQFCKVVVEAFGKGTMAQALMGLRPDFADEVPSWAWGYVNVAVYMKVINGYEDGTFRPGAFVTYGEAVTMLVRAVGGHLEQVGPGLWPYNYVFYAVDHGFNGPVDVSFTNLPATRGDIAQMLFASMQIDKLDAKGAELARSAALADRVFTGVFSYAGTDITLAGTWTSPAGGAVTTLNLDMGDPVYLVGADDYAGLRGLTVTAILVEDYDWTSGNTDAVVLIVGQATNIYAGVFKETATKTSGSTTTHWLKFTDGTEIQYNPGSVTVTVNGVQRTDTSDYALVGGDECVVTKNNDGHAVNIVSRRIDGPVGYLRLVTKSDTAANGADIPTQLQIEVDTDVDADYTMTVPKTALVTVDDVAVDRDTLGKYDVVYILTDDPDGTTGDGNIIEVRAVRETVEGTVAGTTTTFPGPVYQVTIGTTTYTWDKTTLGTSLPGQGILVKYGLDADGELFVPITYETLTPYVVLLSWTDYPEPSSGGSLDQLTVDQGGTTVTYLTDGDVYSSQAFGATIAELELVTGVNRVTACNELTFEGSVWYDVLAVDAANDAITVKNLATGAIEFAEDYTVFSWDDAAGRFVFVPLEEVETAWDLRKMQGEPVFVHFDPTVELGFDLPSSPTAGSHEQYDVTVAIADDGAVPDSTMVRYKAVLTKDGAPVVGQDIYYTDTLYMTTDSEGVVWFGPAGGFPAGTVPGLIGAGHTTSFWATLGEGDYTVTVYVVDLNSGNTYVLGSGAISFTVTGAV